MLRNQVNFKALTFLSEQTASTFNFEVKGVRALWDPSLSIPGTNRRGGWRCPVGTRYGGQITDRFGRSCGWGVARRIANQIADIGERLENVDNRKRNDRLAKRNARMQRFLARDKKPGVLERGVRNIAEALEGEQTPQQRPKIPVQRPRPLGGMIDSNTGRVINLPDNPPDLSAERVREILKPTPVAPRRRRGNLRESEQRRMERELNEPGAPRTVEPPKPNVPRRRRRTAAQQGAKRTARRKPEADFTDGPKPSPTKVPRRKPPSATPKPAKPSTPIPDPPTWNPTADAEAARVDSESDLYVDRLRTMNYAELERQRFNAQNDVDLRNRDVDRERLAKINAEVNRRGGKVPAQPVRPKGKDKPPARPAKPVTPPPAKKPPANDFFDIDKEFPSAEEQQLVQLAKDDIERFKPNAYNNLRGADRETLRLQQELDKDSLEDEEKRFQEALKNWKDLKNTALKKSAAEALIGVYTKLEKLKARRDAINDRIFEVDQNKPFKARAVGADINQPRVVPPVNQPLAPSPITPNTPPQSAVPTVGTAVPDDKIVPDADAGRRTPRKIGRAQQLDDAVKALHENQGNLADVPDGIVIDAVVDGEFKDLGANRVLSAGDIERELRNGFRTRRKGSKFENRRYKFEVIKNSPDVADVWVVLKVEDKISGEKWFMKSSTYGDNDAVLENVGMNAAQVLEFGNDENHLRIGQIIQNDPQVNGSAPRPRRWIMMKDIGQWDHGIQGIQGRWQDAKDGLALVAADINPRDVGRILALDMVLDNQDRHGGNFMWARQGNRVRLGLIDHGLIGGGRQYDASDRQEWAAEIIANPGASEYFAETNNGIAGLINAGYKVQNERDARILKETIKRSVARLKRDLDKIVGIERIEANGAKLSDAEKTHLALVKSVAEARIGWMENNLDNLVDRLRGAPGQPAANFV